jgi:hypothetical protein
VLGQFNSGLEFSASNLIGLDIADHRQDRGCSRCMFRQFICQTANGLKCAPRADSLFDAVIELNPKRPSFPG